MLTVVQRFRADLGIYVHFHCLVLDGAFQPAPQGPAVFHQLSDLCSLDLHQILARVHADLLRHRLLDQDSELSPALESCVRLGLSTPAHRLQSVPPAPSLEVTAFGMTLHAATTVDGRDRKRLERLARYLLRPPFAHDAVQWLPDARVRLLLPPPPLIKPISNTPLPAPIQLPLFAPTGKPLVPARPTPIPEVALLGARLLVRPQYETGPGLCPLAVVTGGRSSPNGFDPKVTRVRRLTLSLA